MGCFMAFFVRCGTKNGDTMKVGLVLSWYLGCSGEKVITNSFRTAE